MLASRVGFAKVLGIGPYQLIGVLVAATKVQMHESNEVTSRVRSKDLRCNLFFIFGVSLFNIYILYIYIYIHIYIAFELCSYAIKSLEPTAGSKTDL